MNSQQLLDQLVELLQQMDIEVRTSELGGSGGSLVTLKGKQILFLDSLADPADQLDRLIPTVAHLPSLDEIYIIPELRELLDEYR